MTFPHSSLAPAPVSLTGKEIAAFRRSCIEAVSGDTGTARRAKQRLDDLPPERARALLLNLWQQEEPIRRRWARWVRPVAGVSTAFFLSGVAVLFAALSGHRQSNQHYFIMCGATCNLLMWYLMSKNPVPRQRGSIKVLLHHPSVELTGLFVDAYSFTSDFGRWIRIALTDALPHLAHSDAPPLDAYQRQVLRDAVKGYARRLRKPSATLADDEAAFLRAAVAYLTATPEPLPAERCAARARQQTAIVVQRLSTLAPVTSETDNRRLVREAAESHLPLMQAGKQK